ncbi:MAG TPA: right-handed parallel beta-helix repeat-containing protein [Terriglobus sp.]
MVVCVVLASWMCADAQRVIHVPADVPTIQQAIAAAANGDTVSIAPGTYGGSIDFDGKAITVQGAAVGVIIQGANAGPVVLFHHGESRSSILSNVTVQGGASANDSSAGGVLIDHASPIVENSKITGNSDCGIGVHFGGPLISGNTITLNNGGRARGCIPQVKGLGISGGGITLEGAPVVGPPTLITGNTIAQNTAVWSAAGISAIDAGHIMIEDNTITANTSNGRGSGIGIYSDTSAAIVQNLIYANVLNPTLYNPAYAEIGAGLNLDLIAGSQHSTRTVVVNNTIAENVLVPVSGARQAGSQILLLNVYDSISLYNNIISSADSLSAVDCLNGTGVKLPLPVFDHNLVFTQGSAASSFSADCISPAGTNGNLFVDPQFVARTGDAPYQVAKASPAVDSGNNSAPSLLQTDLLGNSRVQNATGTATATIDRGAYEVAGVVSTLPPPGALSLSVNPASLSLRPVGSGVVQVTATVTGALAGPVVLSCSNLPAHATCSFEKASLAISGAGTYSTNMMLAVNNATASVSGTMRGVLAVLLLPGVLFGMRKRLRVVALLLVACCVFFVSGCNNVVLSIPASYSVTVVGTDTASGKSAQVALPVSVTP